MTELTGIAWPITLVVVAWMFRDPIKAFIFSVSNKAKKISYLGANIDLGSVNSPSKDTSQN